MIVEVDENQHSNYEDSCECSRISEIVGAGHWVHAEKPDLFYKEVIAFITEGLDCPVQN